MTVGTIKVPRHGGDHVTGVTRVVGVDSKSSAPPPSVRAPRDRESPRALRYGGGSVTQMVAPTVVLGPTPWCQLEVGGPG